VIRDLQCPNQLKHGHWGWWENSFYSGVFPLKAARSPGYRHLNTPTKIGQPEILADLIIRKSGPYVLQEPLLTFTSF